MRVNVKKIGIMIQQNFRSMIVCNFILTNSMGKLVYSDYSFSVLIKFWFQPFSDGRKKHLSRTEKTTIIPYIKRDRNWFIYILEEKWDKIYHSFWHILKIPKKGFENQNTVAVVSKYYFHICHILLEIGKALSNFTSGCKTDAVCRYNRFGICYNKSFTDHAKIFFFFAIDFVYEKKNLLSFNGIIFFIHQIMLSNTISNYMRFGAVSLIWFFF